MPLKDQLLNAYQVVSTSGLSRCTVFFSVDGVEEQLVAGSGKVDDPRVEDTPSVRSVILYTWYT